MEKITAACAMNWSIALEKGLRSKKPYHAEEAILQIGNSLRQWNRDPRLSIVEYNMFDLVPGEDLLFLNTILFRLVNAFSSGDQRTRFIVTNVFLSLSSNGSLKSKQGHGILSKDCVHNKNELIRRLKAFLHGDDVTSRSLALIIFGCWADFSSDNVDIRYMIFSGLQSSHDFEVRASLFAAGCLSEVSNDFAVPVVNMIMNIIISPKTSAHIRLAAVRVFSKFRFSSIIANKVVKMGFKMVQDSSDECFMRAMLIAITKLASTARPFLLEKVLGFLFSFLTEEAPSNLKPVVLKCIHMLVTRVRGCYVPCTTHAHLVGVLNNILENPDFFPALQATSLKLLHEMFVHHLPYMHETFPATCKILAKIFTDTVGYPEASLRTLALESIVVMSGKYMGGHDSQHASPPYSKIIDVCFDRVSHFIGFGADTEFHNLLRLLLRLLRQNPELAVSAVERVIVFTEVVIQKNSEISMVVLRSIYKFMSSLSEVIASHVKLTDGILQKLKHLADRIGFCNSVDSYTRVLFSLLSHYCTSCIGLTENNFDFLYGGSSASLTDGLVEREAVVVEQLKEFAAFSGNLWDEYKIGMYALVQGAWCSAAFIFSRLQNSVELNSISNPYYLWLSILAQFAHTEMEVRLVLSKTDSEFISAGHLNTIFQSFMGDFILLSNRAGGIYDMILSSLDTLVDSSNGFFYFQNWFLNVRSGILTTVLRIFRDLNSIPSSQDVSHLSELSSQFLKLAEEIDLMRMLFVEMGEESSVFMSELALSCSMLAFSTGFTHLVAGFTEEYGDVGSFFVLVEDLMERLGNMDCKIFVNFRHFKKNSGDFMMNRPSFHQKTSIVRSGFEYGYIFRVCEYAVAEFGALQRIGEDEAPKGENLLDALSILFRVVKLWMHIPFKVPRHFFRVGCCAGSEIFALAKEGRNSDGIYITCGSHLSLDICVRPRNIPHDTPSRLYCTLFCPKFSTERRASCRLGFRDSEMGVMVDMNRNLREYVTGGAHLRRKMCGGGVGGGGVSSFVSLRPNGRGQGFSTCVLDTSGFPQGSYGIKWLSGYVDGRGALRCLLPLNDGPSFSVKAKTEQ